MPAKDKYSIFPIGLFVVLDFLSIKKKEAL